MLYTIGHTESYNKGIQQEIDSNEPFLKRGADETYPGGIVFLTKGEAESYLKSRCIAGYSVYGLITTPSNVKFANGINHIQNHCRIVYPETRGIKESDSEVKFVLALFRKFVMKNATQWELGSNHHHPMWSWIATTLGEFYNDMEFNRGPAWRFTNAKNDKSYTQLCEEPVNAPK